MPFVDELLISSTCNYQTVLIRHIPFLDVYLAGAIQYSTVTMDGRGRSVSMWLPRGDRLDHTFLHTIVVKYHYSRALWLSGFSQRSSPCATVDSREVLTGGKTVVRVTKSRVFSRLAARLQGSRPRMRIYTESPVRIQGPRGAFLPQWRRRV